jgi:hypothetical protein
MNADGTEQTRVTSGRSFDRSTTFSPDGKKVAFDSDLETSKGVDNPEGDFEIFAVGVDGRGLTQLTKNEEARGGGFPTRLLTRWQKGRVREPSRLRPRDLHDEPRRVEVEKGLPGPRGGLPVPELVARRREDRVRQRPGRPPEYLHDARRGEGIGKAHRQQRAYRRRPRLLPQRQEDSVPHQQRRELRDLQDAHRRHGAGQPHRRPGGRLHPRLAAS